MEQSFVEHEIIPSEIQDKLDLVGLKREIMKAMPWDSQATSLFASMTPQEIFELVPSTKSIFEGDYGILFENISRKILLKESPNPKIAELQYVIARIFETQAHSRLGSFSSPDFLEINDRFEITKVYECKASKTQYRNRGDQSSNSLETIRRLVLAVHDPNPPEKLAPFLAKIIELTDGRLSLADDIRYIYVLPQELKNDQREKNLKERGYGIEYIPLTKEDATAMYQAVLRHSNQLTSQRVETSATRSSFRSKRHH